MAEVIDWPVDLIPGEMGLGLEGMTRTFESPWTGSTQTAETPGAKVVMQLSFKGLPVDKARRLEALIFSLHGQAGRVRLWDFGARLVSSPQPVHGAPVVTEALAMRKTLTCRGWTPSTKVLQVGDWIQIGDELKRVLADVTSDLSGSALVRVAPMLRNNYPSGTPLLVSRPSGVFMLNGDKAVTFQRSPGVFTDVSLSFVESFYP
ncbi:hypothetical protein [Aeromonas rivipollensis]|uniref:hypothetical protein n=1 Tax=Aeromonas rivipollensis TaxID=948519 RepID=UPI00373AE1CB